MSVENSQLGKDTVYDSPYDPSLLFPIPRAENREKLALGASLPFSGQDLWTCYELSWLDPNGKPHVGIADFRFPADSTYMIESKSFKLYLNSLNHHSFSSIDALVDCMTQDLSRAAQAAVEIKVRPAEGLLSIPVIETVSVDELDVRDFVYQPDASLLSIDKDAPIVSEMLSSDLLRSNCPVTGQPDWGTLYVRYTGRKISRESLLRYVVSFRRCQDFHEHCVERIFTDLMNQCECDELSVYARYTRRGGLDINPYRSNTSGNVSAPDWRTPRQ